MQILKLGSYNNFAQHRIVAFYFSKSLHPTVECRSGGEGYSVGGAWGECGSRIDGPLYSHYTDYALYGLNGLIRSKSGIYVQKIEQLLFSVEKVKTLCTLLYCTVCTLW